MKGMLDPEYEEKITGQMTVRETYKAVLLVV
jgi:translation initiation factor IF-2